MDHCVNISDILNKPIRRLKLTDLPAQCRQSLGVSENTVLPSPHT